MPDHAEQHLDTAMASGRRCATRGGGIRLMVFARQARKAPDSNWGPRAASRIEWNYAFGAIAEMVLAVFFLVTTPAPLEYVDVVEQSEKARVSRGGAVALAPIQGAADAGLLALRRHCQAADHRAGEHAAQVGWQRLVIPYRFDLHPKMHPSVILGNFGCANRWAEIISC